MTDSNADSNRGNRGWTTPDAPQPSCPDHGRRRTDPGLVPSSLTQRTRSAPAWHPCSTRQQARWGARGESRTGLSRRRIAGSPYVRHMIGAQVATAGSSAAAPTLYPSESMRTDGHGHAKMRRCCQWLRCRSCGTSGSNRQHHAASILNPRDEGSSP